MKKYSILLFALLALCVLSTRPVGSAQLEMRTIAVTTALSVTIAAADTPVVMGAASVVFNTVTIVAEKANRTANSDTIHMQFTSADGALSIPLAPGNSLTWTAPDGMIGSAANIYFDGAVGDTVKCFYTYRQ